MQSIGGIDEARNVIGGYVKLKTPTSEPMHPEDREDIIKLENSPAFKFESVKLPLTSVVKEIDEEIGVLFILYTKVYAELELNPKKFKAPLGERQLSNNWPCDTVNDTLGLTEILIVL